MCGFLLLEDPPVAVAVLLNAVGGGLVDSGSDPLHAHSAEEFASFDGVADSRESGGSGLRLDGLSGDNHWSHLAWKNLVDAIDALAASVAPIDDLSVDHCEDVARIANEERSLSGKHLLGGDVGLRSAEAVGDIDNVASEGLDGCERLVDVGTLAIPATELAESFVSFVVVAVGGECDCFHRAIVLLAVALGGFAECVELRVEFHRFVGLDLIDKDILIHPSKK